MKRLLIVLLVMAATVAVWAQSTGIIGSGTLPATCTAGRSIYLKTGASAGFYICLATDTWTQVSATGGAPTTATYITQTADATLSAEQALASLSTGIMRSATTTGVITVLTDSAGIIANISDETGSGLLVFGTSPTLTTPTISGAISFPDDTRQTLNPGANAAGLNVGALAGDPGTPSNGDVWYDSTANELTARINGSNVALGAGGAGSALSAITAATGNASIDSGNNTISWGWNNTTAASVKFTITETAGSSSSGTLMKIIATSASAITPLIISNENSTADVLQVHDTGSDTTYFRIDNAEQLGINCGATSVVAFVHVCSASGYVAIFGTAANGYVSILNNRGGGGQVGMGSHGAYDYYLYYNQGVTNPTISLSSQSAADFGLAGVRISNDGDGALTFLGLGNGSDEDLTLNLDDTANTGVFSSSTGLTTLTFTSITLNPAAYSVAGTAGATGTTCTAFTSGLCTTATEPLMTMDELIAEVLALRRELAALKESRR